ncbi:MAG: GNAT family N-acetyltransferase [Pseudomonadota bacterium]
MELSTARFTLRAPEMGDAAWITRELANPNVHCWLANPPRPYLLTHSEEWIARRSSEPYVRVVTREGRALGVVTVTPRDDGPYLGYWLEEAAWGQGIMTEAAHALVTFYYESETGPLNSGWLDGNAGSEGVLRKLGFTDRGTRMDHSVFYGGEVLTHLVQLPGPEALQAAPSHAKRA